MKKFLSILLVTLLVCSTTVAFADVERPDRITMVKDNEIVASANKTTVQTDSNVSLAGTTVEIDADRHTSFGQPAAILDGIGMVGSFIDNDTSKALITNGTSTGTAIPTASTRWVAKSTNVMPTFTITFTGDRTFNEVRWSEARRIIGSVEMDFYNDGVKVNATPKTVTFADTPSGDDNNVYLRKANLGENVTADKVVIRVTNLLRTDKNLSITEMEFGNSDVASVSVDMNRNTSFGTAESLFDGIGMVGSHINNDSAKALITNATGTGTAIPTASTRWVAKATNVMPTFTVEFTGDRTFSEIRWTEARQVVGSVEVKVYNDNEVVLTKTVSPTSYEKKSDDDNFVYLRIADLGAKVTGDKVEIAVKSIARTDKVMSITEMEFWNGVSEPSIVDATGAVIVPANNNYTIDKAFDGILNENTNEYTKFLAVAYVPESEESENYVVKYELPITISFDLGAERTFNYAQLNELRCAIGEIDVYVSSNGTSFEKIATMPKLGYDGDTSREYIHSVSFDAVTARYVKFVITEMASFEVLKENGTQKAVTISEISVYNYPTVSDEVVVYPVQIYGRDINANAENFKNSNTHVTVNNTSDYTKVYNVFGASYTSEGALDQVRYFNLEVAPGKQRTYNIPTFATMDSVKLGVFVWNSEMTPYMDAVTLEKTVVE